MKVEVYTIAWNEERFIKQFIDYYSFADKIFVFDNHSTDNTAKIAKKAGCIVTPYGGSQQNNIDMLTVKATCWQNSKADWVIVCDVDEWLYHKDGIHNVLKIINDTKATIVETKGYAMISEEFLPLKEVTNGFYDWTGNGDKCICFRPDKIKDMHWSTGCHRCNPEGEVAYINYEGVKILHFSMVGRKEFIDRCNQYKNRMSQSDIDNNYAGQYLTSDENKNGIFNVFLKLARNVL